MILNGSVVLVGQRLGFYKCLDIIMIYIFVSLSEYRWPLPKMTSFRGNSSHSVFNCSPDIS